MMAMGNGGHISKDVFTGDLGPQVTRRSRRWGDARIMARHLRHTCARFDHPHTGATSDRVAPLYRSNIYRRISSGSTPMVPLARLAQLTPIHLLALRKETYIDLVLHRTLPSVHELDSLPRPNPQEGYQVEAMVLMYPDQVLGMGQ